MSGAPMTNRGAFFVCDSFERSNYRELAVVALLLVLGPHGPSLAPGSGQFPISNAARLPADDRFCQADNAVRDRPDRAQRPERAIELTPRTGLASPIPGQVDNALAEVWDRSRSLHADSFQPPKAD